MFELGHFMSGYLFLCTGLWGKASYLSFGVSLHGVFTSRLVFWGLLSVIIDIHMLILFLLSSIFT
jgi:hypothetical protein